MYHYVPIVLSSSFLEAVFHQFLFLDCDRIVTQVELGVRSLNGQNACIGACHVGNQWQLALLLFNDLREDKRGRPAWSAQCGGVAEVYPKTIHSYAPVEGHTSMLGSCTCDKGNADRRTDIPTDRQNRQIDFDGFHFYCQKYLEYPAKGVSGP